MYIIYIYRHIHNIQYKHVNTIYIYIIFIHIYIYTMIYHLVHDNSYLIECIMALFLNFVLQLTKSSQNITESHNDNKSSVFCDPHTLFYNDRQVPKPIVLHGMSPRTPRTPCLCKSSKPGGSSRRFPKKNITDFNQFQQLHITSNK